MSYQVTIEPAGTIIQVEEDQTILDAALRQGVWLPFACGHGTCGTCKVQVTDGFYDVGEASPFALMDIEREENKVLACCCKPESDMVIEADVDEDEDFLGYLVQDYQAKVIEITDLSPTIKGVRLQLDRPMQFQAGQYINIQLPNIEGTRAFSIANTPSEANLIELHIRKVQGGAATRYVHDELSVGEEMALSGPYGQFFVRKSDQQNVIFIAGGSGLSSPQSMILDLLEQGDTRIIYLFQGARDVAELYNREKFEQLVKEYPNFRYIPALNAPKPEDQWTGFTGYVHEAVANYFENKCSGHKAYLCGPPPMIDAAISTLMQSRLFEKDIHTERFLSAADGANGQSRSALFRHI
ncbi:MULTISPECIES: NADH:ubiquinone reductase (Na(+)-transporting) subunit F [Acinetobacter]|jgi:phenol hydroxylase P5 protein|uniref:NADH:ubiquinone reductase (Na(+)-transporting) subunit F n=1 Tax=Acinetobacter TaxID=469 RepID=UPI00000BE1B0|nr:MULTISPECIES: phenol 2-monooxygenase domain-containing protein [Acinetobacter]MCU4490866.1 2Fe-2S iron-sulfur cluster binding domain-containing protein [Acinetobacter guillouiae]MDI1222440.1 phenol 2-monooxygenase domain-containing protein [Acinetobacter sp.]MDN5432754.1 2Fe-2S iron-sulfur cluster-binding protein [Acinetobacter sp.]MDO6644851.1 phenol 2-monooxygenase domain-containing protein [Acinetobacter guillouiae]UOH20269.1 2Fe-2S iron-sulfur cluster-binding protein [Acinetobacter sp. 